MTILADHEIDLLARQHGMITPRRAAAIPAISLQTAWMVCDIQTYERRAREATGAGTAALWRTQAAELRRNYPAAAAWLDSREVAG